jgi:glyoxylase-like metal-dependent hydrolase (beta-lactamase superfamily II)
MSWFTLFPLTPTVWRISEPIGKIEPRFGVATVNMFLVVGRERAALIDTGMGIGDLAACVRALTPLPVMVCNTHFHWDHSGSNRQFEQIAIHQVEATLLAQDPDMGGIRTEMLKPPVRAILPSDFDPTTYHIRQKPPTHTLCDTDKIDLGGRILNVLHTPGHSIGHIAYYDETEGILFSGDTAYRGPMYACFKGSDPAAFDASARRLAAMADEVRWLAPGHHEILQGGAFLRELAAAMDAALSGAVEALPPDDFIGGRECRFDAFAVWLPKD